jgi:hypothetical protein
MYGDGYLGVLDFVVAYAMLIGLGYLVWRERKDAAKK